MDAAFDVDCHFQYVTEAQFQATGFTENPGDAPCEPESPVHTTGNSTVGADLTGLADNTTYHLRLLVSNASPTTDSEEAADTFTTLAVDPPSVISVADAIQIKPHSAVVEGVVERPSNADPAFNVECRVEFVSDQQLTENEANSLPAFEGAGSAPCAQNPIEVGGQKPISAELGLSADTTYHYRLTAENQGGSDTMVAANTFTTPAPELPTVTIDPVAGGTFTTAHVSGTVTIADGHTAAPAAFEISTDGGATWSPFLNNEVPTPEGVGPHVVEKNYTGLQPNTSYSFRLSATYSGDVVAAEANGEIAHTPAPYPTITTEPPSEPATAEGLEVSDVTANGAHFSATVDPNAPAGPLSPPAIRAYETRWHFECTPECKNANGNEIGGTIQGEEGAQTVAGDARRLDANTEYEVLLVVSNEGGGETLVETFNTPLIKPTVGTTPGGSDGHGGYTLQGVVNPNGSEVTTCEFKWGPNSSSYAFGAPCSPMPGGKSRPVTVEAHLTGLTPGVVYHYDLVATNAAGPEESGDRQFVATLSPAEACPNEQLRVENNSLALPECRAYEKVTPEGKEGFDAEFKSLAAGGDRVLYVSGAGNIARSGIGLLNNPYVADRTPSGWTRVPDLNGSSGSLLAAPSDIDLRGSAPDAYSEDLLSSLWRTHRRGGPPGTSIYLRSPDGTFTLVGSAVTPESHGGPYAYPLGKHSADLTHLIAGPNFEAPNAASNGPTQWGPGVYEFVGTNVDVPRRVDLDNSGAPVSSCIGKQTTSNVPGSGSNALDRAISSDGRVIVFTAYGALGAVPGTCGSGVRLPTNSGPASPARPASTSPPPSAIAPPLPTPVMLLPTPPSRPPPKTVPASFSPPPSSSSTPTPTRPTTFTPATFQPAPRPRRAGDPIGALPSGRPPEHSLAPTSKPCS